MEVSGVNTKIMYSVYLQKKTPVVAHAIVLYDLFFPCQASILSFIMYHVYDDEVWWI